MAGRFVSNNEYGAANLVALVLQYREKHGEIDDRLVELAGAIDDKIATLRNELLGGASSAYDTFKELQDLFLENKDLLEKLEDIAGKHVRFDVVQTLTSAEKALARANIEAASLQAVNDAVANAMPSAPTATVSKVGGTATITLKDKDGTTSVEVHDGATGPVFQPHIDDNGVISWSNNGGLNNPAPQSIRGPQGPKGEGLMFDDLTPEQIAQIKGSQGDQGERGPQGFTFKPSVSASGVITWTNDGNLTNPPAVDIRGPKGDTGDKGDPFVFADFTQDQLDGLRGPQGVQGVDGERGATFTPSVSSSGVITWSNDKGLTNPPAANIRGPQGVQGVQGVDGEQGATFIPSVSSSGVISWSNNGNLTNPAPQNIRGPKGDSGEKGDPGAGLTIHGEYASYEDLVANHPVGDEGDAYLIQGDVWYWAKDIGTWSNAGKLQGPKGDKGDAFTYNDFTEEELNSLVLRFPAISPSPVDIFNAALE